MRQGSSVGVSIRPRNQRAAQKMLKAREAYRTRPKPERLHVQGLSACCMRLWDEREASGTLPKSRLRCECGEGMVKVECGWKWAHLL